MVLKRSKSSKRAEFYSRRDEEKTCYDKPDQTDHLAAPFIHDTSIACFTHLRSR